MQDGYSVTTLSSVSTSLDKSHRVIGNTTFKNFTNTGCIAGACDTARICKVFIFGFVCLSLFKTGIAVENEYTSPENSMQTKCRSFNSIYTVSVLVEKFFETRFSNYLSVVSQSLKKRQQRKQL